MKILVTVWSGAVAGTATEILTHSFYFGFTACLLTIIVVSLIFET